jgi:hypothetical protein
MSTERQIQETIDRSISLMVYFHNGNQAESAMDRMVAEIELLAAWVVEELHPPHNLDVIIGGVEAELVARYGNEAGHRLTREFAKILHEATARFVPSAGRSISK